MLQQLQQERMIPALKNTFVNVAEETDREFDMYHIPIPGELSYLFVGLGDRDITYPRKVGMVYTLGFDFYLDPIPRLRFNKCTLFLKQGTTFLTRVIVPTSTTFQANFNLPPGIFLHASNHIIQCEYDTPEENFRIKVFVDWMGGSYRHITRPVEPPRKENKPFSDSIIVKYDNYTPPPMVPALEHSIEIINLSQDYLRGQYFHVHISGAYIEDPNQSRKHNWEISCDITQTLKDGTSSTNKGNVIVYYFSNEETVTNPKFIFNTFNTLYYAGSNLRIQCPGIQLYKSRVPNGPNFHLTTAIRGSAKHGQRRSDEFSFQCEDYPCSLFMNYPATTK